MQKLWELSETNMHLIRADLIAIDEKTGSDQIMEIHTKLAALTAKYQSVEEKIATDSTLTRESPIRQETLRKIEALENGSAHLTADISDVNLRIQLLENTTYNGRTVWKIDNLTHRKQQAVTGQITCLHSAPSFQERSGYKFYTRLYLNGDGVGKHTHVSVFFVLGKSEYDALLQWPFGQKVLFRLINPYDNAKHVTAQFTPDVKSNSYARPTKDMNVAVGCPKFLPKNELCQYITDDCIFIETIVDPTG